jgi:hypothetical protein
LETFPPSALNCDDRPFGTEKALHVSRGGRAAGVERDARTIARDQIVAKTLLVDRPDDWLVGVFRGARLELCNPSFFADVEQHDAMTSYGNRLKAGTTNKSLTRFQAARSPCDTCGP